MEVRLAWLPERVELEVRNPLATLAAASAQPSHVGASGSQPVDPVAPGSWSPPPSPRMGHGIIGMRERAQLAGGTLTAMADDEGFAVRATLPIGAHP